MSFELIVDVAPDVAVDSLTNTATVAWDLADGSAGGTDSDSETVPVSRVADLRVTKFGKPDGEVRAGENLTYTIIVDNLGPSFAPTVTITDEMRSDGIFEFLAVNPDVTGAFPNQVSCIPPDPTIRDQRATLTCTLEPPLSVFGPPAGAGRWIVEVVLTADEGVDINNCASVSQRGDRSGLRQQPHVHDARGHGSGRPGGDEDGGGPGGGAGLPVGHRAAGRRW